MASKLLFTVALAAVVVGASGIHVGAAKPYIEHGVNHETFSDDFILDLCGIETMTTVDERWTYKEFADGSSTVHVVRTFTPEDERIPVEKGAATSFTESDGSRRVVGKPLHLFGSNGTVVLDAGWVTFGPDGSVSDMRGPHPSLGADMEDLYCPPADG